MTINTQDLSPEELLELLALMEKAKAPTRPLTAPVSVETIERVLDSQGGKAAVTRAMRPRRQRTHWKEKKRKKRERMRPYMAERYRQLIAPKRKKMAENGEWYSYYLAEWKKRGYKVELKEADWESEVAGKIGPNAVPVIFRFNTAKPVRLENLMIKDTETKEVLFDGQEWMLKKLGAIE